LLPRDAGCRRPVFGDSARHRDDPAFRDHVLFYDYFHGDTGRGIGAAHQTRPRRLAVGRRQPAASAAAPPPRLAVE
jgi:hypothetical protein